MDCRPIHLFGGMILPFAQAITEGMRAILIASHHEELRKLVASHVRTGNMFSYDLVCVAGI